MEWKWIKLRKSLIASVLIIMSVVAIHSFRPYSRLLLAIFPPSDLYSPIIRKPISLNENKAFPEMQVSFRYVGKYKVGLYVKEVPFWPEPLKSTAVILMRFKSNGEIIYQEEFKRIIGRTPGLNGIQAAMVFGVLKVPENIPMRMNVMMELSVVSPDPDFKDNFGDAEFFIKRLSDQ